MLPIHKMLKSSDYDKLIDQALALKDKEWFEELVQKQKELREAEREAHRDFGNEYRG